MMLFRKKSDGKYYTREVKISYTPRTSAVEMSEVYEEVYRELPEFGPDSKTCVIRIDGGSYYKSGYMFYTAASNPRKVLVKERTQEIGIRRALGAPPTAIISQILSESFILTFIAGVVGLTAAVGVLSVADSIYYQAVTVAQEGAEISWQISFGTGMLALFILVAGSLLAGVIPAYRALSIKAVDAIREE